MSYKIAIRKSSEYTQQKPPKSAVLFGGFFSDTEGVWTLDIGRWTLDSQVLVFQVFEQIQNHVYLYRSSYENQNSGQSKSSFSKAPR